MIGRYEADIAAQTAEHNDAVRVEAMADRDAYLSGPDFVDDRGRP